MGRVAETVRVQRAIQRLSQEELAFVADIHRTQISLIESGSRSPRLMTILKLCGAFDITPNELLDGIRWVPGHFDRGAFVVEDGKPETP